MRNMQTKQGGYLKLIIIIIIALFLLNYFGLTFSDVLNYFGVTVSEIGGWIKQALDWLKDLFMSVAR